MKSRLLQLISICSCFIYSCNGGTNNNSNSYVSTEKNHSNLKVNKKYKEISNRYLGYGFGSTLVSFYPNESNGEWKNDLTGGFYQLGHPLHLSFINNIFFLAGTNPFYYSYDGVNWSKVLTNCFVGNQIIYDEIKFLTGKCISNNGIDWIYGGNLDDMPNALLYGNNIFYALLFNPRFGISNNGIDWQMGTSPIDFSKVIFANGQFIGININVLNNNVTLYKSLNGVRWDLISSINLTNKSSYMCDRNIGFVYANNKYLMIVKCEKAISLISKNLINWEFSAWRDEPTVSGYSELSFANNMYYYIEKRQDQAGQKFYYSLDGVNWNENAIDYDTPILNITYGNNKFVAVGNCKLKYSSNGIDWFDSYAGGDIFNMVKINDKYYIMGACRKPFIAYSYNGNNWQNAQVPSRPIHDFDRIINIAYNNGTYVAIGSKGIVLYSLDGINWKFSDSAIKLATGYELSQIYYAENKFIIIGQFGTIMYSNNGIDWNLVNTNVIDHLNDIVFANDKFTIVGNNGIILNSGDAVNWTNFKIDKKNLKRIVYGNGVYVIVANGTSVNNDDVFISIDGDNWQKDILTNAHLGITNIIFDKTDGFIILAFNNKLFFSENGKEWSEYVTNQLSYSINGIIKK